MVNDSLPNERAVVVFKEEYRLFVSSNLSGGCALGIVPAHHQGEGVRQAIADVHSDELRERFKDYWKIDEQAEKHTPDG